MYKHFIVLFFFSITSVFCQNRNDTKLLDSIYKLRNLSKVDKFEINKRIDYAKNAIELSKKTGYDSTLLGSKRALSSLYLESGEMYELKEISLENFELAKALKDSLVMANADYILGYAYEEEVKYDSAYYHYFRAAKVYKKLNNNTKSGEVILNMANIQNIERDYIGSEINAIEAKKLIEQLPETNYNLDTLWLIHNLLGVVSGKLKLYDKALEYHALAYKFASKMTNGYYYKITTSSNIASIYRKKAQYNVAVDKYNEILENKNLITYDSASYASTISNIAYAKFLSGIKNRVEIEKPYREAMHIAKDINNNVIEIYTYLYLSKYFEAIKQSDSAKKYINKAYDIAKATKTNDVLLESLILKASLAKDSSQQFLMEHIKLSDSLVLAERSIRNKFARIDYETEAFKQQKEIVSRQNILLIIASSILAITLLLLYVIKTRREKIKELQLAQQQQQANEEIYNLMLSQQDKMDEARAVEKKRISQDIHDGILGRLFGVRLNLDNLNFIKTDDGITRRSNYINELKEIEFDIRKVSHDLNTDFVTNSSFSGIIKTLVENQCDAYGLEYAISIANSINWELVSNKTKVHIYRITQESLQNIYKHAEASLVSITIDEDNNSLSLAISDDGKGFESDKIKDGIGLKNIKSRVQEINAKFNIKTTKNEGTTVEIEIPI